MMRVILALVLGGGLGAAAANVGLQQFFGVSFEELWSDIDDRGPVFIAVVVLPILFLLVRGWAGMLISMALVAAGVSLALKFGVQDDAPWTHVATMGVIYSVVAVGVYRLLVSRAFG